PNPARPDEVCAVGRIKDFNPDLYLSELSPRFYSTYPRELQVYLASLLLARDDARLDLASVNPESIGLFNGSSRSSFAFWYDRIRQEREPPTDELYTRRELMTGLPGQTVGVAASLLKIRGPTVTFAATCSSGAFAIGHAYREIRDGEIDVAFATGHDLTL